jgi:hypothetical protein
MSIFNISRVLRQNYLFSSFYDTLPTLPEFNKDESDFAFFLYDLVPDDVANVLSLKLQRVVYTKFANALEQITQLDSAHDSLIELSTTTKEKFTLTYDGTAEIQLVAN